MEQVKWEVDFRHHMWGTIKGSLNFSKREEDAVRDEWVAYYSPFAERINAEGGLIRAYVINGGFNLQPKLERISHELKEEIRAAGLRV